MQEISVTGNPLSRTLTIAMILLAACETSPPPVTPPRPALVITVGSRTTAAPILLVGEIRPRFESAQGFRIPGKIISRHVEVGTSVHQGQLLVKLDNRDTSLSAQAAEAEVRVAEAEQALASAELARYQQLQTRKFVSEQSVDIKEAQFKTTTAKVNQARRRAEVSDNQTGYTELKAERGGIVTGIHAEPGQVTSAGDVIVRIAVPDTLEAVIAVPESRMNGITVGTAAQVSLWSDPSRIYAGHVREVAPAADSVTRTFQVRVALSGGDKDLRMGMTAGVKFSASDDQDWLLPLPAVTQRNGQSTVWVVDSHNQEVHPRVVQTGMFREDGVIIRDGLNEGDQVVVAGVQTLVDGQIVRPQAAVVD